ncbi:hypothetical protein OGM63_09840 [Plectonema radiosum NIES-515]|uniref:Uncharacterized protein n=1 Tax=Plectonema radiosum NIES-515 TaxID=2986073 RepID=A0ABT3AXF9_9CYAN|nr:hypothetical protein [Plectonema radiosum]MCV3213807.1 hypothetical protein [Plectonema radiosum NIES-515]
MGVWRMAMLAIAKKNITNKYGFYAFLMLKKEIIRLFVPALAVAGWMGSPLPGMAITATYANDYRVCAGRLLSVGVTPDAASVGCANALRPKELSLCVSRIQKQTQIAATDALASCKQARRPEDLAACVVGISANAKEAVNPAALNYCSRSLLPVRFAECVVGLRAETDSAPVQAMDNCIDASDRAVSGYLPSFIPATRSQQNIQPVFESTPIPTNPPRN